MFVLIFEMLIFFSIPYSSLAMSSGATATISSANYCDSLVGLVKRQRRICKKNLEVMESVKLGAHEAIQECQYQFKNRRWNCSMVDPKSLFGNVLKLGQLKNSCSKYAEIDGVCEGLLHQKIINGNYLFLIVMYFNIIGLLLRQTQFYLGITQVVVAKSPHTVILYWENSICFLLL